MKWGRQHQLRLDTHLPFQIQFLALPPLSHLTSVRHMLSYPNVSRPRCAPNQRSPPMLTLRTPNANEGQPSRPSIALPLPAPQDPFRGPSSVSPERITTIHPPTYSNFPSPNRGVLGHTWGHLGANSGQLRAVASNLRATTGSLGATAGLPPGHSKESLFVLFS